MKAFEDMSTTLSRIRGEYHEMPGLKLTVAQAARLWHVEEKRIQQMLDVLVADGLLRRTHAVAYLIRAN
jgi:hypothetical protein